MARSSRQASFVDREDELDRLTRDLLAGQKVFLISPRRYGKSSLIRQSLAAAARGGALIVDVTVSSYSSYVGFLEGYARALSSVEKQTGRAMSWLREVLAPVRPEVRIDRSPAGKGAVAVSFPAARSEKDVSRLAQEVFALPGRIADSRGRKLAIALDEFQAIAAFNGGSVEHALRAAVQVQRNVGYVFSGSEPALMERMLGRSRPFYKAGPVMRLGRIPADRFAAFIETRHARQRHQVRARPRARRSSSWPATCPTTCSASRTSCGTTPAPTGVKALDLEDLHGTLTRLLGEQESLFEATWQRLTLAQRGALRAAVLEDGRELLVAPTSRARYRLSGASTVQASLAALVREDVLAREGDRYLVVDSLLREWVARRTF